MPSRHPILLSSFQLGELTLPNRVVMAPMTRSRANNPERAPFDLHAEYYRQRATAGLLITEATSVSPQGVGYVATPGIWSDAQEKGWKKVTDTVHASGGRIFLQLWHVGRVSHPAFQPDGGLPVSSSAVGFEGSTYLPDYSQAPYPVPRALRLEEIPGVVASFGEGARRAKAAGFDGVEIHGANSYLIDQFLRNGVNQRIDSYGGSIENRVRLALEVVDATVAVWGKGRVGLRLSPTSPWNGMSDSDPLALYTYLAAQLKGRGLAYLHVLESPVEGAVKLPLTQAIREAFGGTVISNTGYTVERAEQVVAAGDADLVAFGVPYIANPDLVERFRTGAELNVADPSTFYGGAEKGYTDYPALTTK
ncbi:MAG: alkene reductase [Candidatus Eisenbacteria bacterium]